MGKFWRPFFVQFLIFDVKNASLNHAPFLLQIWVALSILHDGLICNPYTPVQSQTHFWGFALVRKNRFQKSATLVTFGTSFGSTCDIWCGNRGSKKRFKKRVPPPEPNDVLFTDREAPGGAASCARCSDKKQLFEQQLRHCSKFLQKKVVWAQNRCKKADRIAESLQTN